MRYGFINNFSQALAADLAAGATTMTLDGGGTELSNASADLVYTLTLDDGEGTTEIVHVTGQTGNDLTIEKGKEGTADAAWTAGSTAEMRVTARVMDNVFVQNEASSVDGVAILSGSSTATVGSPSTVLIGNSLAYTYNGSSVVRIGGGGYQWNSDSDGIIAIGYSLSVYDYGGAAYGLSKAIIMGSNAYITDDCGTEGPILIAPNGGMEEGCRDSCLIGGGSAYMYQAERSVGLGYGVYFSGNSAPIVNGIVIGKNSWNADSSNSVLIGGESSIDTAPEGVGLGAAAKITVPGGARINALEYIPKTYSHPSGALSPSACRQAAGQVSISSAPIDLTNGADFVTLDLPAGTRLFIDSIDVVITGSDTPGGSPEISVGPDDVTPAAYLASTAVTRTVVGERQTHTPIVADGVTSLRVATTVAGTGTTYTAKIVFRGYVMEL